MENELERRRSASDKILHEMMDILQTDLTLIDLQIQKCDSQVWRRAYCRALFSYIEGIVFRLKQDILILKEGEGWDSEGREKWILTERREFELESGKTAERPFFVPFLENFVFALEEYAFMNWADFKIDTNSPGWDALKTGLAIRNRTTHPKCAEDLSISDDDLTTLREVHDWFLGRMRSLLSACYLALNEMIRAFETRLQRAHPEPPYGPLFTNRA